MKLLKNRISKKGFSLLELLLVLGIIAALVVAAFIVYPKVQASQRSEAESNNIATIQTGVKALYTSAQDFSGLNNSVAVQAKIFPDNMLSGSGAAATPINVFKGPVILGPSADSPSGTPNSSFNITYVSVPSDECTRIVSAVAANFFIAKVNQTIVKTSSGVLDVAATAQACNEGGTNNIILLVSI